MRISIVIDGEHPNGETELDNDDIAAILRNIADRFENRPESLPNSGKKARFSDRNGNKCGYLICNWD